MAVRTAKGGKVDVAPDAAGVAGTYVNIPEVRVWRLRPRTDPTQYASSSTAGARKRLGGTDDFAIDVSLYVDETSRFDAAGFGIVEGNVVWLKLYEDSDTFYVAPAFIEEVNIEVDIEGGGIVNGGFTASSNGVLQRP